MTRDEGVQQIQSDIHWDVAVIGGGATGLGIALEATTRGYKTLLVEQSDFAKSTSGKSTKLIHGGVRYLAQGNLKLVREATIERGLLRRNAPHLVKDQTFIIPIYDRWQQFKYTIGLKMYDWIAGTQSFGSSVFIPRNKIIQQLSNVNTDALLGVVLYHDGQFDDARLAINLAQTIADAGGTVVNYMQVTGLLKDERQKLSGLIVKDLETLAGYTIRARSVINATGVFVDDIIGMDNPAAGKSICVSQGAHIVVDKKFYPSPHALMIPRTSDGRVLFAVPWRNKVVIGTTDTPVKEASLEPLAMESEISFILHTAGQYLTEKPQRSDVLSVFTGLRPLAAPKVEGQKTKEISRSHKIVVSRSCLFTILGGKWTTYRKMGEDMLNRIEKELHWPRKRSATATLHIHGYAETTGNEYPISFYGSDYAAMRSTKDGGGWISDSLQISQAQVYWAVQHEMARTVEDVLSRRTRALLMDARESMRMAPAVAAIMASALGKNEAWIQQQVADYCNLALKYILK